MSESWLEGGKSKLGEEMREGTCRRPPPAPFAKRYRVEGLSFGCVTLSMTRRCFILLYVPETHLL